MSVILINNNFVIVFSTNNQLVQFLSQAYYKGQRGTPGRILSEEGVLMSPPPPRPFFRDKIIKVTLEYLESFSKTEVS